MDEILELTEEESFKYYKDNKYREKLEDKKLILNLAFHNEIKDVSALGNVHTLDLSYCQGIKDVSALGNVHTLNLNNCDGIHDVSSLKNVHTLNLSGCNIEDVSELGNIHTLKLSYCYKIKDISGLKNVYILYLTQCNKIKDVSELIKVEELVMSNIIKGTHLLKNIKILSTNENIKNKGEIKKLKKYNNKIKINHMQ
jgi:hypothetical protein